ncbi:Uu.00g037130.m01.CDS01 [Anthostomella pinea]|uniref:Uu.00g037130.m01.CDS01 n=1 Tax=Anthostomella pinea TaxID=933095 RepID=A0AAI8VAJ7_9PEZI|nr:Uu.00g037130.m01.CDS01 [Anthostomella pinea]
MPLPLVGAPRGLRTILLPLSFLAIILVLIALYRSTESSGDFLKNLTTINGPKTQHADHHRPTNTHAPPKYKPTTTFAVPAVTDPFPLLASSTAAPPPIPAYNVPRDGLHRDYGLAYVPPLFIGFTRQWPMLLQCVVGYITAGWPPESIYVVENTGVQNSNADDKLSLQNPFYLNHTTLRRLGVNVLPTPVLLTFSQMQNFFLSTATARSWPYYFYSHQDVLVFSFEDGADVMKRPGDREWFFYDRQDELDVMRPPAAGQKGYRTIYENCLRELNRTVESEERWAFRWFQYDHLTLVNRAALDAVGGWDSLMPYYGSDCDMNARLEMDGWSMRHRRVGIINDVSTVMEDLSALYRDPNIVPKFVDPNPIAEEELEQLERPQGSEQNDEPEKEQADKPTEKRSEKGSKVAGVGVTKAVDYFRSLVKVADDMGTYKYRSDKYARNSWQNSQHGGTGEPYYYNAEGFASSFWILAEAGHEVFRQKWGHRDCNLVEETALQLDDQWRVEKDWED